MDIDELFDSNEAIYDRSKTYIASQKCGYVVVELQKVNESRASKVEQQKFDKEYKMCKVLADNGYRVVYRHSNNNKSGNTYDIVLNGKPAELKQITGGAGNIVKYAKKAANGQGAEIVVFELPKKLHTYWDALKDASMLVKAKILYFYTEESKVLTINKKGRN